MARTSTPPPPPLTPGDVLEPLGAALPEIDFVELLRWDQGRTVRSHAHKDLYQLDHFTAGEGIYRVGGEAHAIDPSTVFLVPPGTRHGIAGSAEKPLENLTVKFRFPGDGIRALPPVQPVKEPTAREVERLLRQVVSEAVLDTPERRTVASLRLVEALILLLRAHRESRIPEGTHPLVASAGRFMAEHLASRLTLGDVARAVGVTGEHLCRTFKRETGLTPFGFLRQLRVDRAKEQLAGTRRSIASVAAECGFGAPKDMNRAFRRLAGASPTEFRRGRDDSSVRTPRRGRDDTSVRTPRRGRDDSSRRTSRRGPSGR